MSELKYTPEPIHVKQTEEKVLSVLRESRGNGLTFYDTAVAVTKLYYELSEDLRQENEQLGFALQKAQSDLKAQKALNNQQSLIPYKV